jgi:HEAT repeat protein
MADVNIAPEKMFDTLQQEPAGERRQISDATIRALCGQLTKEENPQVIEVIIAALGGIGLPEAQPAIEPLVKNFKRQQAKKPAPWEQLPQVKCMAIWSIGRLGSRITISKAQDILLNGLTDSYFKIRAAACQAISQIGEDCGDYPEFESLANRALPILQKLLKDGQLNKQSVAETIVQVGI